MNTMQFLLSTVISIYGFIFVLRAWFQIAKVDFYHPLSQALVKVTQPVLNVLGKFAPTVKGVNLAALLACFIFRYGRSFTCRLCHRWHPECGTRRGGSDFLCVID